MRERPVFDVGAERACRQCGARIVITERMKKARRYWCAVCVSASQHRWRLSNREYLKRVRREHAGDFNVWKKAWLERNPDKKRAHIAMATAIASGRLVKPSHCENCAIIRVEAHHDDYSKPLSVRWLCRSCHKQADRERRDRERMGELQQCG
jgi:hypothetical protein